MKAPARARGFTLVEVLVALVILGLALGVLLRAFSLGLRNADAARAWTEATLYAESKLAEIEAGEGLSPGVQSGRFDERFRWRAQVQPYTRAEANEESGARLNETLKAYEVIVTVIWGDSDESKSISLTTLRLAPDE